MTTLVCVPLFVHDIDQTLAEAGLAKEAGADLVEFRIDSIFDGSEDPIGTVPEAGTDLRAMSKDTQLINDLQRLIAESPLPVVLTCRDSSEGGDYDGDETDRVSLLEKLTAASPSPPAYLDFELARYQASANIRQKINLCVDHPKQTRDIKTRLILSIHDFDGRPSDLHRQLAAAYEEPACAVVKVAYRCRSIRDNIELFEILESAPKPTIALGMGEFGLMSRVLAPKFGGYLTFASLTDQATTAPGQPTIRELLDLYRFHSINKDTQVYGIIGWPVTQSMSPLIHNAGFEVRGINAVYLPMPVAADSNDIDASRLSLRESLHALFEQKNLHLRGASITVPHKQSIAELTRNGDVPQVTDLSLEVTELQAANTLFHDLRTGECELANTDVSAIIDLLRSEIRQRSDQSVAVIGAGGVASAAVYASSERIEAITTVYSRRPEQSADLVSGIKERRSLHSGSRSYEYALDSARLEQLSSSHHAMYINCTPVGMKDGPAPDDSPIDIEALFNAGRISPETVFFDTVYNPIETPMLKAARAHGCKTIDGVQMFVKQAAAQFELWTGEKAPVDLFDRLVRETLS